MKTREILFRGKRVSNGNREWIEGVPYDNFMICGMALIWLDEEVSMSECPEFDYVKIDPETVGRYTGRTDKNGKKMFEGDVVEAYKFGEEKFVNSISFRQGCFWFGNWIFTEFLDKFRHYKVVGNIHDNPKLLEVRT